MKYVEFNEILAAKERISSVIIPTPLIRAWALDDIMGGAEVYIKAESLQKTGSFKIRGAANKIFSLSDGEKSRGVITASSGNHGQGVAMAASHIGVSATVVMPEIASPFKIEKVKNLGAKVVLYGVSSEDANRKAAEIQEKEGQTYVHAYCDRHIIAGQGTAGLEIMEACPDMDAVVVPIGGGGLISGIALAVKSKSPKTQVIGVEPAFNPRFAQSRKAGKPLELTVEHITIADGIRARSAKQLNFDMIEKYVDTLFSVEDRDIIKAIQPIMMNSRLVFEPTSYIVFAAAMFSGLKFSKGQKVCFFVSGGNVDFDTLIALADGKK